LGGGLLGLRAWELVGANNVSGMGGREGVGGVKWRGLLSLLRFRELAKADSRVIASVRLEDIANGVSKVGTSAAFLDSLLESLSSARPKINPVSGVPFKDWVPEVNR